MRRKDREVTDAALIDEIIMKCHCCRLGFNDGGRVYIVPLNFGYVNECGQRNFYFHGAYEGRKMDLIRNGGYAAFEMDTDYVLHEGRIACDYTAGFKSVFGEGRIEEITDASEKECGLLAIMRQAAGRADFKFDERHLASVYVFRLSVETISCKVHA